MFRRGLCISYIELPIRVKCLQGDDKQVWYCLILVLPSDSHLCIFGQVSMAGLTALLALLHHMQFYQEIEVMMAKYYPQPAIHPVSVVEGGAQTTPSGSDTTVSTLGKSLLYTIHK